MKKFVLFAIVTTLLSINAHADWDAAGEAREAAERKASQERRALEKAKQDKLMRETMLKNLRARMGKEAVGKSDAEVEHIYKTCQADILKQAAAFHAAVGASNWGAKKSGVAGEMEQSDAVMKALYDKSMNDIANMSPAAREAFLKDMQKKSPK